MHGFAIGLCCLGREGRQLALWKTGHSMPLTQLCSGVCVLVVFLLMVASLKQHAHNWRFYRRAKMSPETEIRCASSSPSGWLSDEERGEPDGFLLPIGLHLSAPHPFLSHFLLLCHLPRTREMHVSPEAHRWCLPEDGVLKSQCCPWSQC